MITTDIDSLAIVVSNSHLITSITITLKARISYYFFIDRVESLRNDNLDKSELDF